MFITLTRRSTGALIRINKLAISAYFADGEFTTLFMVGGGGLEVLETPEQIDKLIGES